MADPLVRQGEKGRHYFSAVAQQSISTKIGQNGGVRNLSLPKMGKMVELGTYLHQNVLKWWSKEFISTKNGQNGGVRNLSLLI